jgi:flavodoxin/Pyruvate/2-oxoacid:ferredoxin oxidoreductase delta subunit
MKKCAIYYFSGTGNTEYAARKFKEELALYDTDIFPLDFIKAPNIDEYDLIGLGFPVYAGSSPSLFKSFVSMFPASEGKKVFVFCTNAGGSGKSEFEEAKSIQKKGYDVVGAFNIKMSSNFPAGEIKIKDGLKERVDKKISEAAMLILSGNSFPLKFRVGVLEIVSYLFSKFYNKAFSKKLYTDEDCTHCGVCTKFCPSGNISMIEGKIIFSSLCIVCMRCLHNCPFNAIRYKGKDKFKTQYRGFDGNFSVPRK